MYTTGIIFKCSSCGKRVPATQVDGWDFKYAVDTLGITTQAALPSGWTGSSAPNGICYCETCRDYGYLSNEKGLS